MSEEQKKERGLRKTQEGRVVSNKMDKSVVVAVTTHKKHPQYGQYVLSTKRYMAHDKNNDCNIGDRVLLAQTRPLSKKKRWSVCEVLERAV